MATNARVWPIGGFGYGTPNRISRGVHYATSNQKYYPGMQVCTAAILDADANWGLAFQMPGPTLPAGELSLVLWGICSSTSEVAKWNPKYAYVSDGEVVTASLTAHGTVTVNMPGTAHMLKKTIITLDDLTPEPDTLLVMNNVAEDSGWTISVFSTWWTYLEWIQ